MYRICIVDTCGAVPNDPRLNTIVKIMQDTIILARSPSVKDSFHFGLTAVVCSQDDTKVRSGKALLQFQDWSRLTLPSFNQAFAQLRQLIGSKDHLGSKSGAQKWKDAVGMALKNITKQFKEMKKKDVELKVSVITLSWFRDIQTEIETFIEKESRTSPIKYVQVVVLNDSNNVLGASNKIQFHFLPEKGLDLAFEIICKEWLIQTRLLLLVFQHLELPIQVNNIVLESSNSPSSFQSLSERLIASSFFSKRSIPTELFTGWCLNVTSTGSDMIQQRRWKTFWTFLSESQLAALIEDPSFDGIYALVPSRDFCFVLQPLLPHELLTAGGIEGNEQEPFTPELDANDAKRFGETAALNLPICSSYGLGLEASVVHQLKTNWVKENAIAPSSVTIQQPPTVPPTNRNVPARRGRKKVTFAHAHPALGLY